MAEKTSPLLNPHTLSRLSSLELIARKVVEGFITGLHKSPFHGFSVEFSQHRPYMHGDSLRFIDWKVFARSDRYYVKQFEEETNLRCYILVDASASMAFESNGLSKYYYACMLSSALSYLLLQQRDASGLVLFDEQIRSLIPARSTYAHLKNVVKVLEDYSPRGETRITETLHQLADRIKRRSLVILISDLFDEPQKIAGGLKHILYNNHELLVFQILDNMESHFDFKGETEFIDLENEQKIKAQPKYIREHYLSRLAAHNNALRQIFTENQIDFAQLSSSDDLGKALVKFISKRSRLN